MEIQLLFIERKGDMKQTKKQLKNDEWKKDVYKILAYLPRDSQGAYLIIDEDKFVSSISNSLAKERARTDEMVGEMVKALQTIPIEEEREITFDEELIKEVQKETEGTVLALINFTSGVKEIIKIAERYKEER